MHVVGILSRSLVGHVRPSKIDYVFSVNTARDKFYTALLNFISENARYHLFFFSMTENVFSERIPSFSQRNSCIIR